MYSAVKNPSGKSCSKSSKLRFSFLNCEYGYPLEKMCSNSIEKRDITYSKGERYISEVYGVKRGAMENVVTISGWRPQVCETPVYEIKDTDQNENKREFLVISRITHVMNKRSYFSHHFLNEVSHTGVNLDNARNCI